MAALTVDTSAPDFSLLDQDGQPFQLSTALKDGPVVLYFYPKDETYGCTAEACAFRDAFEAFTDAGTRVVGVSADSVASHKRFQTKHRLPFTLLSDPGKTVHKLYGVDRGFLGLISSRVTFVIDRSGRVRKTFDSLLDFQGHVRQSLEVLARL